MDSEEGAVPILQINTEAPTQKPGTAGKHH